MKKKMLYVKPGLKGLGSNVNVNAYCSPGSGASAGSKEMCQEGISASYCSGGTGDSQASATCFAGTVPASGSCSSGQSADGWSSCDNGVTVGMSCGGGSTDS